MSKRTHYEFGNFHGCIETNRYGKTVLSITVNTGKGLFDYSQVVFRFCKNRQSARYHLQKCANLHGLKAKRVPS